MQDSTITNADLMSAIKEMNANLEKSNEINAKLIEEVNAIKNIVFKLEEKTSRLEDEIKYLKKQQRKNNFIIHNVPIVENENVLERVKSAFREANVNIPEYSINSCYRLGKGPILMSLNNNNVKQEIFKQKDLLKNKNILVSHDKTPEEREEGKKIFSYMVKLKNIDQGATYRKGLFKIRGSYYRLNEIESFIRETTEPEVNASMEVENTNKKRKAKEKLENFAFRPRGPSVGQNSS